MNRFWGKVNKTESCWLYLGGKNNAGYGFFWFNGRNVGAHRFSYELAKGRIPDGFVIDHLCRNTSCVNPHHLEAVTQRLNVQRGNSPRVWSSKTHCPKGHEYSGTNLYVEPNGIHRRCRACAKQLKEKYKQPRQIKTNCKYGHKYSLENTITRNDGKGRDCRTCHNERTKKYRKKTQLALTEFRRQL